MSSYSDFANAASDILLKKGAAEARGREDSGQIWGNTLATLGDVIPKQVQQVLKERAAKQKTLKIQQIIQQNGGDLEKALPLIMGVDVGIGSQIGEHVAKVNKDVAEYQGIQAENKKKELDFSDRILQTVNDPESYARWAILQQKLGRIVPDTYNADFIKQEKANLIAQKQALEPQFAYGAEVGVYNKYTGETKTPSTRTPKNETELAIDAADPNSPTQERSATALKSLRGTTGGLKTVNELRIDAANPNSPTRAQSQQILDNLPESEKITGPEQDERYRKIMAKPPKARTGDESAWAAAYERQKTLGPMAMPVVIQTQQGPELVNRREATTTPITTQSGQRIQAPISEAQSKDVGFAKRLDDTEKVFAQVQSDIAKMNYVDFKLQEKLPAAAQSAKFQPYDQASRNLINAILRRESGAAISQSEFDNARAQYLPQPGDTAQMLALKAQNRQRQREALIQGAGPFYQPESGTATGLPKVGETFQGGKVLKVTPVP